MFVGFVEKYMAQNMRFYVSNPDGSSERAQSKIKLLETGWTNCIP